MRKRVAFEFKDETAKIFEKDEKLKSFVAQYEVDTYPFGIVVSNENENEVKLKLEDAIEEEFPLYWLSNPDPKRVFTDFGFISDKNNYYLYQEFIIPFSVTGYNEKEVGNAIEQMDEHLVAIDHHNIETIYFVERYHESLIEKIAQAYKVDVTFYT